MNNNYLNIYNNLIQLTTNKSLYKGLNKQDVFYDRLVLYLIHFAFFLKTFKNKNNTKILQEIYDLSFRQLELSIREIGYGDQSINKKMKDYINLFHSIVSEIHFWDKLNISEKQNKISIFTQNFEKNDYLIDYFDKFYDNLKKKNFEFLFKKCK